MCEIYKQAQELESQGVHVVSTDEMTGIQALERICPQKPAIPGMPAKIEFEYTRHGTVSLIGFFNVATGVMVSPYINQTRNEFDFVSAIKGVVETDPNASWVFVLDCLNTHMSERLVKFVAEVCRLDIDLRVKGKYGILENMKTRAKFLNDPSHRIRFVYTPKHCSSMNQIEIWFSIISRKLLKRQSYASTEELTKSIFTFIHQYNLTARPFKWTARPFKWTFSGNALVA